MGGTSFIEHGGPGEASEVFLQLVDAARAQVDADAEEQDREDLRRGYGTLRERPRSEDEDTGTIGDKLSCGYITVHDCKALVLVLAAEYSARMAAGYPQIQWGRKDWSPDPECVAILEEDVCGGWDQRSARAAAVLLLNSEDPRCNDKYGPCAHIACNDGTHVFFGWSND